MTIKSAERLVYILEAWGSNLVKWIDYPVLEKYVSRVLSGHYTLRSSSKTETALFNKPLDVCCSYSLLACDTAT